MSSWTSGLGLRAIAEAGTATSIPVSITRESRNDSRLRTGVRRGWAGEEADSDMRLLRSSGSTGRRTTVQQGGRGRGQEGLSGHGWSESVPQVFDVVFVEDALVDVDVGEVAVPQVAQSSFECGGADA